MQAPTVERCLGCRQHRVTRRSSGGLDEEAPEASPSCGACPKRSRLAARRRASVVEPPSKEGEGQGVGQRELVRSHCSSKRSSSTGLGPPPATKAARNKRLNDVTGDSPIEIQCCYTPGLNDISKFPGKFLKHEIAV